MGVCPGSRELKVHGTVNHSVFQLPDLRGQEKERGDVPRIPPFDGTEGYFPQVHSPSVPAEA